MLLRRNGKFVILKFEIVMFVVRGSGNSTVPTD